jgi:hypothetical protein
MAIKKVVTEEVYECEKCEEECECECSICAAPVCDHGCNGELYVSSNPDDSPEDFYCTKCAKVIRKAIENAENELKNKKK